MTASCLPLDDGRDADVVDVWTSLVALPRAADRLAPEGGVEIRLRPILPPTELSDTWIRAAVGKAHVDIGTDGETLAWLVSHLEPAFDVRCAPADVKPLILEAVFEPWIRALEQRISRRIAVDRADGDFSQGCSVAAGVEVEFVDTRFVVSVRLPPDLGRLLGRWAASLPLARTALSGAGVPVSLRIGFTGLTLLEAAKLQPETGLLLEHRTADPVLVAAETLVAPCTWTAGGVQLQADPAETTGAERNWIMSEDEHTQSPAWKGAPGGLSNLPVRLIAEVGRLTLTVEEVSDLKAGSLVDFGGCGDAVAIYAGGVHLADGRLVEIDGRSLVRIERLVLA